MKKLLSMAIVSFLLLTPIFSLSYRITSVTYNIKGKTKAYAVDRTVKIDTTTVFADEESLDAYIKDYKQRLENTRMFDEVIVEYTTALSDEEPELYLVIITATLDDSFHFIGAPYPKYDSNDGFELKLKMKDTNFLGTMNEMTSDLNLAFVRNNEDDSMKKIIDDMGLSFGFSFNFDLPFSLFSLDATWTNKHKLSYTIGHTSPEWDFSTGLDFSVPLGSRCSANFSFAQKFTRDFDYKKYNDDIFFAELATISLPIVLQKIENWGNVNYSPYISGTYYWDFNGINKNNPDLTGPRVTIGQTISTSRIDWKNNLRTGLSLSTTQSFTYNTQKEELAPKFSAELKAFKGFKYAGFCSDIYFFVGANTTENIGSRLRGIRDGQYFSSSSGRSGSKACDTTGALVINLDLPIHIFSTHFTKNRILRKLNFEVQLSPFIDFALHNNKATDTTFSIKDGFYAAGMEIVMHLESWKSIQVRGSFGVDVGRALFKRWLNTNWRSNISIYEIAVGIGLHY
ncbi:MAG: hypothetical protein J6I73_09760 [Treponema sp.]|nr:hypothetical protein [Treponema sp.]